MLRSLSLAAIPLLLIACDDTDDDPPAPASTDTRAPAGTAAAGSVVALGLTEAQLLDADLIDANGVELGEVERVERNAEGTVDRLLVEVEDSNPDRFVHVPIASLEPVQQGDDWDLRADTTRDNLMTLPEVRR